MEPAFCNEIHIHIYSSIHIHFADTLLIDEISTVAELSICRPTPFRTSEPGQIVHEERIFAREKNASRSRKKRWEERICASIAHRKDSSGLARVTNSLRELSYCRKWQNIKLWPLSSPRNSIRSSILRFLHHSLPLPFSFSLSPRELSLLSFVSLYVPLSLFPRAISPGALYIEELLRYLMVFSVSSTVLCFLCISRRSLVKTFISVSR